MNSNMFTRLRAPAIDPTEGGDNPGNVNAEGVPQVDPNEAKPDLEIEDEDDPDDDDEVVDDDEGDDEPKGKKGRKDDTDQIERIARAVATGMHQRQPAVQQQEKPLSEAEIKKLLNVYEIDNDTLKEMLNLDKDTEVSPVQLKAAQRMVASIVKNATTVSNATATAVMRKLEARLAAYDEFIAKQTQEQAHTKFYSKFAELKPYDRIVGAVATNLADTDPNWANYTFEQGAKLVAKDVRRILKDSGIKISKPVVGEDANLRAEPTVRVNGVPTMAALAGSGRSSTTGQRGKSNSVDEDVYGPGNTGW